MKKLLLILAAMSALLQVGAQKLPGTIVTDVRTGVRHPLNKLISQNKLTLICFWGTWCAHGKHLANDIARELPAMQRQVSFDFVAIASDEVRREHLVLPYIQKHGWGFPCYIDVNGELKKQWNFDALPYTVVIDKNGKVAFTHTGYIKPSLVLARLKEIAQ